MKKYTHEFKMQIVEDYKNGQSCRALSKQYGIDKNTVLIWCRNLGEDTQIKDKGTNMQIKHVKGKTYTNTFRLEVVAFGNKYGPENAIRHYKIGRASYFRWAKDVEVIRKKANIEAELGREPEGSVLGRWEPVAPVGVEDLKYLRVLNRLVKLRAGLVELQASVAELIQDLSLK